MQKDKVEKQIKGVGEKREGGGRHSTERQGINKSIVLRRGYKCKARLVNTLDSKDLPCWKRTHDLDSSLIHLRLNL